ncbi:hypothetical protein AB0M25_23580 [Streptomyces griseomycini]|uniref:hypothetical protein n=1 Tax=Streptomyces griseomycini TaxID=66895 RepID=UPI00344323D4
MEALISLGWLGIGLLLNEAVDISPWLARRILRWAAHRLPDIDEARAYEEEWTALLDERPGKLLKLVYALTFILPALQMRRASLGRLSWPRRLVRRHVFLWSGPRMLWSMGFLGLASMGLQMISERIPPGPENDPLFYWLSVPASVLMGYLGLGMMTATHILRRQKRLAAAGDAEAQREVDLWYGERGTARR